MKNIVIFSNCAGHIIANMFDQHEYTKNKYSIVHITNYTYLNHVTIDQSHVALLNNCDIFMYQPLNQEYTESEYNIENIKTFLNHHTIVLKINYYRFRGFWYNSECKPYTTYENYHFHTGNYYGIHDSFANFNSIDINDVIDKIDNVNVSKDNLLLFFDTEVEKFKRIDDKSDVNMVEYFIDNYKTKRLFHDPFHPTNLFFYEMFRQIVLKLTNHALKYEDYEFINTLDHMELAHWALPILPIVKTHLELELNDNICVFFPADKRLHMNVYDYYYIRLSHANFQNYLNRNVK